MKKLLVVTCTLFLLAGCKSNNMGMNRGWLEGDRSTTVGDQTSAVNVVYFDYDSSKLTMDAKTKVMEQVNMWMSCNSQPTLVVEGHADERGTIDYNIALGERRAYAVKKELMMLGIPESKIQTVSYGKERPAVAGHDENAWKLSRRSVTLAIKN